MTPGTSNQALLSLGSNIEPERNLPEAVRQLSRYGQIRCVSTVWESPPFGYEEQANFLNAAVWLETDLSAAELKDHAIAEIERVLGRIRGPNPNGPRTIDIDIVFFNPDPLRTGSRYISDTEALEHPYITIPLGEIAPEWRHPETGETLAETAAHMSPETSGMRRRDDVKIDPPRSPA
ncbi:2-amino-4-hydroxy-6-hydroxymethyldihydropteridine diphosphokinase [Geobacter sp. DSM 9736]|uniref:2-amino-4-hydroxy-6- hydroxymethyldihydropteridine diphosphokinase n=1 Tax=Geobacter sp. DSM 9736 TaxID=1277350 RepID=UPI000B4FF984|nr:2-amino-4-hydroxy-6-hydroxymethyldihydropteridine diphosphokinase [Geobacter sp. DSM 9736]SNB47777.1 2-amino-4-hydroxy-6-hydroxymethyldihydropteridinediphosphokinase [Geobacter sp. DSM 9736]